MKTPSQLRQWACEGNAKNVGEVTKRRHAEEVGDFTAKFDYLLTAARIFGDGESAEKAEKMCAETLQNGTDNKELFNIAFKRIDEAIWLIGRLNAAEKQKAAETAEALIAYDKMHGGLLAPILNKFRKLLA